MTIKLGGRSDVLHITLVDTDRACESVEVGPGIVCRVDPVINEVVGITIMSFTERAKAGLTIPDLIAGISASSLLLTTE